MKDMQAVCQKIADETALLETIFSAHNRQLAVHPQPGKWSPLQHLDHLLVSAKRVNLALAYAPKWFIRWQYGTPNRPSRTYPELVARYHEKLAVANPTNNPFSSGEVAYEQRAQLLRTFMEAHARLSRIIQKWKPEDLDRYLIPHPLLGKLLVRELFYFMAYHLEHHRVAIERDMERYG